MKASMYKDNEILSTDDYDLFRNIECNRQLNEAHVNKLAKSLTKTAGNILPVVVMIVDGKFVVVDGQHRIEASMLAKTKVNYVVLDAEDDLSELMVELNVTSKNWAVYDFVEHFSSLGVKGYSDVVKLKENLSLHSTALFLIIEEDIKNIKMGKPIELNYDETLEIGKITERIMVEFKNLIKPIAPRESRVAKAVLMISKALSHRTDSSNWSYDIALKNIKKVINNGEISDSPSSVVKLLSKSFDYGKRESNRMDLIPQ